MPQADTIASHLCQMELLNGICTSEFLSGVGTASVNGEQI